MIQNFQIISGIYLVHKDFELDLHNDFLFTDLIYSVERQTLALNWQRSQRKMDQPETPKTFTIEFNRVSEFRFMPRDPGKPFSEDDCVHSFGNWTDEDWADGVIICSVDQVPDSEWLTAIEFMSGAVLAVKAESANIEVIA